MDNKLDKIVFDVSEDVTKQLWFDSSIGCENEVLIADLYVLEATTKTATISNGADLGKPAYTKTMVNLDVTGIALGLYALKIWTAQTGVIAKAKCLLR